jgi:hypothetical protein
MPAEEKIVCVRQPFGDLEIYNNKKSQNPGLWRLLNSEIQFLVLGLFFSSQLVISGRLSVA